MNLFLKKFQLQLRRRFINFPEKEFLQKCYASTYTDNASNIFKKMEAWQIHEYNSGLQLTNARTPIIKSPNDVLIKVEAASVNPIDIAMSNGYGSQLVGLLRKTIGDIQFPLTLGRDFSGKVLNSGFDNGSSRFKAGQQVWGVVPVHWQGSHAQTVLVPNTAVSLQPSKLKPVEAASLMYAGVTAWCALWVFGGLLLSSIEGKRALVLGASGGVGSIAVQLLKAENAHVFASCSTDAIPFVQALGADEIFNYAESEYTYNVRQNGPYDIILDCAGLGQKTYLDNNWQCRAFVTLSSPVLKNTDQYGLFGGLLTSAAEFLVPNVQALSRGGTVRWAYFIPLPQAIQHIGNLVEQNKLKSAIDTVFAFDQIPDAYKKVANGHLRGKVVINMEQRRQNS